MAVAWPRPEPVERVLPWALELERLGVAGFGWGIAWLDRSSQRVRVHKDPRRAADDEEGRAALGGVTSSRYLVHVRRPTRLSTTQMADTQPFLAEDGSFAFCHNGFFRNHEQLRPSFAGRLAGRADSEVGFRLCQELLDRGLPPEEAVARTHARLEGRANIGLLGADGTLLVRAGNSHNDVWSFDMDGGRWASSALHSADESLFDLLYRGATHRRRVEADGTLVVGPASRGTAARSSPEVRFPA